MPLAVERLTNYQSIEKVQPEFVATWTSNANTRMEHITVKPVGDSHATHREQLTGGDRTAQTVVLLFGTNFSLDEGLRGGERGTGNTIISGIGSTFTALTLT